MRPLELAFIKMVHLCVVLICQQFRKTNELAIPQPISSPANHRAFSKEAKVEMLNFVTKEERIDVLTSEEGIAPGYIKDSSGVQETCDAFFPNNNMMFKAEWLIEIATFMQNRIDLPGGKIWK